MPCRVAGSNVITVNDYLAKRDTQWMGPVYHALGLSVGVLQHEESFLFDPTARTTTRGWPTFVPAPGRRRTAPTSPTGRTASSGSTTFATNMKFAAADFVQRKLNYAIVDEVDNILIDEARTPLIISGPSEESTDKYYVIDRIIPRLKRAATITSGSCTRSRRRR